MDQEQPTSPPERPPVQEPRPGPRLSRPVQVGLIGVGFAVIAIGFLAGPALLRSPAQPPTETPAPSGAAFTATSRQWATLKIQTVEDRVFQPGVETDGKIAQDDDRVTPVLSPYSGHVIRLIAVAGDRVQRGDPLFAIQATELAQAQNDLITAVAGLRTATAQLNLAATNEKRQHALYLAQGAALRDWQQAQVDLATAQGGLSSAQIALASVRSRLRILGKSDAEIAAIEASPDPLSLDADAIVRSPIAGTVVQRQIGLGQNIVSASAGGTTPVFMIGDLSKVWMIANAREDDTPYIHNGDPVAVRVPAWPGRVFNGRLNFVAGSIDPITHRLAVRAEVENPHGELKPEMLATFRIVTGLDVTLPAVPANAVVFEGANAHVWVADDKAKSLEIRPITPGPSEGGMVEVTAGLKAGEKIVTAGAVFIDRAASGD